MISYISRSISRLELLLHLLQDLAFHGFELGDHFAFMRIPTSSFRTIPPTPLIPTMEASQFERPFEVLVPFLPPAYWSVGDDDLADVVLFFFFLYLFFFFLVYVAFFFFEFFWFVLIPFALGLVPDTFFSTFFYPTAVGCLFFFFFFLSLAI